jgi:1-acyl-sn-glycerol-3-phosphate acyltransferase
MDHLAVDPEQPAGAWRALRRAALETSARGEHLLVFPQGTLLGIEAAFREGAFLAARAARLPIWPIVISGSHRIWEHPFSSRLRYGQRVAVRLLEPVAVSRVVSEPVPQLMAALQAEMKRLALSPALPAPRRYDPARDGLWDGFNFQIDPAFRDVHATVAAHRQRAQAGSRATSSRSNESARSRPECSSPMRVDTRRWLESNR